MHTNAYNITLTPISIMRQVHKSIKYIYETDMT